MKDNLPTHRSITPWYWLLAGLFLLWILFVLASFYVVQNAFARPIVNYLPQMKWLVPAFSLSSVADTLLNIIIALWICFIALGTGRLILRLIISDPPSDLDQVVFGIGLGYGGLGFLVLALGLLGLLDRWLLLSLATGLTLVTLRSSLRFMRSLRLPKMSILVGLFLVLSFGLALSLALLPPSSWDGLFYHLKGPQLYLEAGRIYPGIDIPHLNFPALMEMNFMLGIALRNDVVAVLINYSFALLLVGLVYLIARELFRVKNAWWAVLFLLATSFVLSLSSWAYNDLALAFYEVSALYALLNWRRKRMTVLYRNISDDKIINASEKYYGWLILGGLVSWTQYGL